MSCSTGKVGYVSPELANHALYHSRSVAKKGELKPLRWYYCHECEKYHLTSQPKKRVGDFISWLLRGI